MDWDRRILPVLRWSIFIQIAFSVISNISPRIFPPEGLVGFQFNVISLIPIGVLGLILLLLFYPPFLKKLTRRELLILLVFIALLAILYRYTIPLLSPRSRNRGEFVIFRFDNLFFLIIPLVFIAWQFSIREVIFYCLLITFLEVVPQLIFFEQDSFIGFVSGTAAIGRGVILAIVGWVENSLVVLQRTQQKQLEDANKKILKQAAAVESLAQSQERNRLARELHDTLAHTLSGNAVQLEAVKVLFDRNPDEAKHVLDQILANTRMGLDETRKALMDLRTSPLETYGLTRTLRNTLQNGAERAGYRLEMHIAENIDQVTEELAHCIFRVTQEAVENTIRHASAKTVQFTLKRSGSQVMLEYVDDGSGFNPQTIAFDRLGLRGMRERVEMLGGTFKLESMPGKGTSVTVQLSEVQ